jgi:hypothetical protein
MAGLLDFLTGGLLGRRRNGNHRRRSKAVTTFGASFNFAHGRTLIGGLADALTGNHGYVLVHSAYRRWPE